MYYSGGIKLLVLGQNLNIVQQPRMKFISNITIWEYTSVCYWKKKKT